MTIKLVAGQKKLPRTSMREKEEKKKDRESATKHKQGIVITHKITYIDAIDDFSRNA
jgi:hypothetical protein